MKAAVVQMVSGKSIDLNLIQARKLVEQAVNDGAQLIALPENFAYFTGSDTFQVAEAEREGNGPISTFLSDVSQKNAVWIVAGTMPKLDAQRLEGKKTFAASTVWSPDGVPVAQYNKCHLFDVEVTDGVGQYRESDLFLAGGSSVTVDLPFGCLGLSVCYDVRFPELYRLLQKQGANILSIPSAFTYATGKAHWDVLLRARAIENQCFVLAANQGGEHGGGRVTWGHSCIISPSGDVLAIQRSTGPGVAIADLDFGYLDTVRNQMPCLKHRKF